MKVCNYTKTPPDKVGFYFHKFSVNSKSELVEIFEDKEYDQLQVAWALDSEQDCLNFVKGWWSTQPVIAPPHESET